MEQQEAANNSEQQAAIKQVSEREKNEAERIKRTERITCPMYTHKHTHMHKQTHTNTHTQAPCHRARKNYSK